MLPQRTQDALSRARQVTITLDDLLHLCRSGCTLRENVTKFRQMASYRIEKLGLLAYHKISCAKDNTRRLRRLTLHTNEAHFWPLRRVQEDLRQPVGVQKGRLSVDAVARRYL